MSHIYNPYQYHLSIYIISSRIDMHFDILESVIELYTTLNVPVLEKNNNLFDSLNECAFDISL